MEDPRKTIGGYTVLDFLGHGSYGNVYSAEDTITKELVALKVPKKSNKNSVNSVNREYSVYRALAGVPGVPKVSMMDLSDKVIMISELLGDSLDTITKTRNLSISEVALIAMGAIDTLKHIHLKGYIHRDIKPSNITFPYNTELSLQNRVYLIDYGLSKQISTPAPNKFCGTTNFASIAAHKGEAQHPKDDLESLAYTLVYLLNKKLPWQKCKLKHDSRKAFVLKSKMEISEETLCEGLPHEICVFLKYAKYYDVNKCTKVHYRSLYKMFEKLYKTHSEQKSEN